MDATRRGYCAERRLDDELLRAAKAKKLLAMAQSAGVDTVPSNCLDVGCALGLITKHLAPAFRQTVGLEYDPEGIAAAQRWAGERLSFVRGDGLCLPIADESIDVAVCAQVYEHVGDPQQLMAEIRRVLKPGGICLFTGPNRLFPFEFHSRLPFVHWLPYDWTCRLVKRLGRGDGYDAQMLALPALRRLMAGFEVRDLTVEMLRDPERYACSDELGRLAWIGRLPRPLLRGMLPFMPNFNWLLTKRG